jgi:UDP-N-acetylglucosamine--N-acetylmuramyl-(pentapeptide) pyrophosphoryl-undecaprenol N-acetylglucosamine transferase
LNINKVIISAGGTGGHIYPAIAVAESLKKHNPSLQILFVGAEGKMEMEKVPKAGFEIIGLPIAGINRSHIWKNINFPFKLISSLLKASAIIRNFKPDTVIGFGGYASGPILILSRLMNIPYFIQEQNSFAGITNKFLAKKAEKIFVAYPNMAKFFPQEKIIWTGNPVRKDLISNKNTKKQGLGHFDLEEDKLTILIIGGSQGARTINQSIASGLKNIPKDTIQLIWQTGNSFEQDAKEFLKETEIKAYCSAFIYEMDKAYAAADLIVSRAGALSVSEICLAAKPSILVPFPNAAEDHQTENAKVLVQEGAAILVPDNRAKEILWKEILTLVVDKKKLESMGQNAFKLAKPDSTENISQNIIQTINIK